MHEQAQQLLHMYQLQFNQGKAQLDLHEKQGEEMLHMLLRLEGAIQALKKLVAEEGPVLG